MAVGNLLSLRNMTSQYTSSQVVPSLKRDKIMIGFSELQIEDLVTSMSRIERMYSARRPGRGA